MTVTMNISLPEALRDHVQKRVAEGGFANASDFLRSLIREDRERQAKERLEHLLLEGLQSGEPEEATDAYWQAVREEVARGAGGKPRSR
jgi:antitoxin ParD1/3/4